MFCMMSSVLKSVQKSYSVFQPLQNSDIYVAQIQSGSLDWLDQGGTQIYTKKLVAHPSVYNKKKSACKMSLCKRFCNLATESQ